MSVSVHQQVCDEILRVMQEELAFNPADDDKVKPIDPKHIVFRKVSVADRDINRGKALEHMPGILLSPPFEEPFSPGMGTNGHDVYRWSFLAQICDKDSLDYTKNINSYWLWQELISRKFQFMCLKNVDALHAIANVMNVDTVDERYWLKEETFKAGATILVQVWLTRTST